MKKLGRFLVVGSVFLLLFIFAFSINANAAWRFATIQLTGVLNNDVGYVLLTPQAGDTNWPAGTMRYFTMKASVRNQILATALTCTSLGKDAYIFFDSATYADWTQVSGIAIDMR